MKVKRYYSQKTRSYEPLKAKVWTGYCWLSPESKAKEIANSDKWCLFWLSQSDSEKKAYCRAMEEWQPTEAGKATIKMMLGMDVVTFNNLKGKQ